MQALTPSAALADVPTYRPHIEGADHSFLGPWHIEGQLALGMTLGDTTIANRPNGTGGEQLDTMIGSGIAGALLIGLHNDFFGGDIKVMFAGSPEAKNEFGDTFENHFDRPGMLSLDLVGYPLGHVLFEGGIRPYVFGGAGLMSISADTDNAGGKENYTPLFFEFGGGVKFFFLPDRHDDIQFFLDVRFTRIQASGSGDLNSIGLNIVTVGLGLSL